MMQILTKAQQEKNKQRISFLYQSDYKIDNLTAILMDIGEGGFGLNEDIARAKAHKIHEWVNLFGMEDIIRKPKNGKET